MACKYYMIKYTKKKRNKLLQMRLTNTILYLLNNNKDNVVL